MRATSKPPTPSGISPLSEKILLGQRRILELLCSNQPRNGVLAEFCRAVEELVPGARACVMLHEAHLGHARLAAAPNLPSGIKQLLGRVHIDPDATPSSAAIHSGEPIAAADLTREQRWPRFCRAALDHELRACWSVPLNPGGADLSSLSHVAGTLDLYFEEPQPDDAETDNLELAASVVSRLLLCCHPDSPPDTSVKRDPLTGLTNRSELIDRLHRRVEANTLAATESKDKGGSFALAAVDVDVLKNINDTLGFKMGDHLLQALGQRLLKVVRDTDTVARVGGDEFVLLIDHLRRAEDIAIVAEKIKAEINAPYDFNGHGLFVTASIGISLYPWDGEDGDTLLRNAETALSHAKQWGGGGCQVFRPSMDRDKPTFDSWWQRSKLGSELRDVLEKEELELYYQLKYRSDDQSVCGAESLVRWNHPSLGTVSPLHFIPMAEQTGLILPIGEWVLKDACAQNRKWQDAGIAPMPVAVNVSPQQFRHGNLVQTVKDTLEETKLEAKYLELEIIESLAMEEGGYNLARLQELRTLGLTIAIDDFGTGFSSLSYLSKFPIDTLKIDQSFIRNIGSESESEAIIRTIISMARTLGLEVVAEGVETEDQCQFLCELGCEILQGYYFSRPLPVDSVTEILTKHSG